MAFKKVKKEGRVAKSLIEEKGSRRGRAAFKVVGRDLPEKRQNVRTRGKSMVTDRVRDQGGKKGMSIPSAEHGPIRYN